MSKYIDLILVNHKILTYFIFILLFSLTQKMANYKLFFTHKYELYNS